ncbi:hypothetical protein [Aurantiacibacter sp. MUD61]|uniref:hypothetical protein n=1 Tax=Aurantiacibacter sp. MUD61 TaxID=3009083 RepID=UPI0022F103D6|nr:hypothetical protein [Aurantiacibacter sp. MUD61]
MTCNRNTAVLASLGFGAILAWMALEAPAPETPAAGRAARGAGGIINGTVEALGPTGAAVLFVLLGCVLAIVSAMLCPSSRE